MNKKLQKYADDYEEKMSFGHEDEPLNMLLHTSKSLARLEAEEIISQMHDYYGGEYE